MLFLLAVLFDQLQAAIAADAVGQMDDQIAFAQLEEAIDRLAQTPPRHAAQIAAMEQLAGGEHERPRPKFEEPLPRSNEASPFDRGCSRSQAKAGVQRPDRVMQPAGRRQLGVSRESR